MQRLPPAQSESSEQFLEGGVGEATGCGWAGAVAFAGGGFTSG
jgi:hypothetical protein